MPTRNELSRRAFLRGASALAVVGGTTGDLAAAAVTAVARTDTDLQALSAVQAIALMKSGDLTSERYAGALLARATDGKSLNAFITLEPARVLEAARLADQRRAAGTPLGALHGLPIPVKDSLNTRDYPTTAGTAALRNFRPTEDAPLVATLTAAGAIVMGKTNLHELSYGWTSDNQSFGAVHNPYDPSRIPGGSSGGTAAAIASRMAPLGIAADTQGSIRVPAALCGISGFRPTTGRYSTLGAVPISALFDQAGPHARFVADLALFDAAATGDYRPLQATPLKGIRLAVARGYFFAGLDPEVERVTLDALKKLTAAGAELVEAEVPDVGRLCDLITYQVQNHDILTDLPKYLKKYGAGVSLDEVVAKIGTDVRELWLHDVLPDSPNHVTETAYRAAVDVHLPALKAIFRDYYARTGAAALVFPATMVTAPKIGVRDATLLSVGGKQIDFDTAIARNISPGSTAALPGLVLPAGIASDGLPVALEFDGPHGSDRALLALGLTLERVLGPIAPASLPS